MPTDWSRRPLGDLTTKIGSGATPRGGKSVYVSDGVAFIRSQNVLDHRFSEQGLARIDANAAVALAGATVKPGDVLVNITGDSVARCCLAPEHLDARVSQHVAIVRPNPEVLDSDYIAAYLVSPAVKAELLRLAGAGATRPALTKAHLQAIEVSVPPLGTQQAIAEVLRSIGDLAFFEAVAVELRRARADRSPSVVDDVELETAIRQVVSDAVTTGGVIDIYAAAGIDKPDISIIDEEFARRLATNPHPNVQIELLRRLLTSELRTVGSRNIVVERRFSEMLERAMRAYTNRSLDAAEVIAELVELAKAMRAERDRGTQLGLAEDELAFYDAVCQNDSAVLKLGDDTLKTIAHELVGIVRRNATVDWDKKEQVRASLRRTIRRLLTKYKYPPDKQESAVALVMQQAEVLAGAQAA